MTSIPTLHWIWPPPKVLKKTPFTLSEIPFLVTTAPIGNPFPIPLAIVIMSGLIPCHLWPQYLVPTLPKPVWTSSQIMSPLYFLTKSTIFGRYPSGKGLIPPTPWMHSKMNPATFPELLALIAYSASFTSDSAVWWDPLYVLGQANF